MQLGLGVPKKWQKRNGLAQNRSLSNKVPKAISISRSGKEESRKSCDNTENLSGLTVLRRLLLLIAGDIETNPGHTMTVMQWNYDGISTRKADLEYLLSQTQPTVVLLQETKLPPNHLFTSTVTASRRKLEPNLVVTALPWGEV
ncbi:hypothetical protein ElyMa_003427100 [Elysia marginata]|uniref:Endonuclease/exonuclease/phosphatase domain-containing protein n=1 Tax=Elysia marginata TaxID=1093978 RepID=A0AAV4JQ09_9GAST|nr:hypothetical protein ElyMa_003427100 [Elysia marginata]